MLIKMLIASMRADDYNKHFVGEMLDRTLQDSTATDGDFAAILANRSVNAYVDEDPVPLHGWQPPEDYLEQFPLDCWARPPTREELSIFWDDDRANIVDNDNDLVVDDNNDNGKKL